MSRKFDINMKKRWDRKGLRETQERADTAAAMARMSRFYDSFNIISDIFQMASSVGVVKDFQNEEAKEKIEQAVANKGVSGVISVRKIK
jgi:hypothetical protein